MKAPYDTNLKDGDLVYVEFVTSGKGNNVRSAPGTNNPAICTVPIGHVAKVVGGPQYVEGMIWWEVSVPFGCGKNRKVVGWTSEGTNRERWLRVIPPLPVEQGNCRAPLGTRLVAGERAYVQDPTGHNFGNRVRESPDLQGTVKGEIPVGNTLRVLQGPVCRDGMAWWRVRSESKPVLYGWTSEGKAGEGFYLVPIEVRRNRFLPIPGDNDQPTFRDQIVMEPDEDIIAVFSPDGEVVTLIFSNMIVSTPNGGTKPQSKSVSVELPVNSRNKEVEMEQFLLGYIWSSGDAQGVITVQQGEQQRRKVWPRESDEPIEGILRATVHTAPSLSTTLSLEIEQNSAQGDATLEIDMMEIKLLPHHS